MANTATTNYKSFIIKAVIVCITIALGIYLGMFFSIKTGLTGAGHPAVEPDNTRNPTNLEIGDQFPDLQLADLENNPVAISPLLAGKKTVLAFVSDGCNPCHDLLEYCRTSEVVAKNKYQILLLSADPGPFAGLTDLPLYAVSVEIMSSLRIESMPIIIGIDGSKGINIVTFATAGFGYEYTDALLEEYL